MWNLHVLVVQRWNKGLDQWVKQHPSNRQDNTVPEHLEKLRDLGHGGMLSAYGYSSIKEKMTTESQKNSREDDSDKEEDPAAEVWSCFCN